MNDYITKKQLLEQMNISYGQLYRWKRQGLIPEAWFVKQAAATGQETVLPRKKIIRRIEDITLLMEKYSLDEIVKKLSFDSVARVVSFQQLYDIKELPTEHVNAIGNYFKKDGYTPGELMIMLCMSDTAQKEHFTTRQYVDLLRYALPVAEKVDKAEKRCVVFAAGGDYHLCLSDLSCENVFDSGLRTVSAYNFETLWDKLKVKL